jgi:eukaryotic-like serine/threonine-protein kinase
VPRARRPRRKRSRELPAAVMPLVLAAVVVSLVVLGAFLLFRDGGGRSLLPGAAASSKPVTLSGVASYDPQGDGDEHTDDVSDATDKDPDTAWKTESYRPGGFTKDGVGLVLRAPRAVALSKLTVHGGGTSFSATIQAGNSPTGGFVTVSDRKDVAGTVTFSVDTNGKDYGYYMVWLRLPTGEGQALISEVTART